MSCTVCGNRQCINRKSQIVCVAEAVWFWFVFAWPLLGRCYLILGGHIISVWISSALPDNLNPDMLFRFMLATSFACFGEAGYLELQAKFRCTNASKTFSIWYRARKAAVCYGLFAQFLRPPQIRIYLTRPWSIVRRNTILHKSLDQQLSESWARSLRRKTLEQSARVQRKNWTRVPRSVDPRQLDFFLCENEPC